MQNMKGLGKNATVDNQAIMQCHNNVVMTKVMANHHQTLQSKKCTQCVMINVSILPDECL